MVKSGVQNRTTLRFIFHFMSSHSYFSRFWTVAFSVMILFVPLTVQAAKPVEETQFTKKTISGATVFEREVKSCAPTSNVSPRSKPDCEGDSLDRTTDTNIHWGGEKSVETDTVACADLEGLASGELVDVSDVAGVVKDGGDMHFDLSADYGGGYDAYEACVSTTSETSQGKKYFPAKGWAWDDNLGWVSFVCDGIVNGDISCGGYEYKTKIDTTTGIFSGYAWGDGTGWLQFNWACPVTPAGVTPVVTQADCDDSYVKLDFATGELSGWAWSDNVGWFDFSGVNVNSFDLSSLWQSGQTVNWDVKVYYAKEYVDLFADCSDAYDVRVQFFDPATGASIDPTTYGYTVSVSDWAVDNTVVYDQIDSGQWTSTTYGTADCPVNSTDITDYQTYNISSYTLESFTVTVLDGTTVKLQKAFEWDDGSFAFHPAVSMSNFCVDYGADGKKPYVLPNNNNKKTSATLEKQSVVDSGSVSITQKLFSSLSNKFEFTGGSSTEETQTVTFTGDTATYEEYVDTGDGGDSCTVVTYCLTDYEGGTECVETPGQPIPRYTAYGVGIPLFEAKGTENTAAAGVDVAKVTRNTLYTALKKVVGASEGKSGGGTLQNGTGSDSKDDLNHSARNVNSDAEFLNGALLYFTGGDVTFDDDPAANTTPVSAGMIFTDVGDLVSGNYAMTWTDPVTVVVEGGDIYIDENLWGDTPIGLIALDDGSGGGHIYIEKDVTNIKAVMYADYFVTSYDADQGVDSGGQPIFSTTTRSEALGNQLYVVGSIVSGENTTDLVDADSDGLYSDDEVANASAENFNWMREFKLYPGTTDGNPNDYDEDGEIEDCSDGFDGFPYLDPTGALDNYNPIPCDHAWIASGDLIVDDNHRLAAGVTDTATTLDEIEDLLPFYLYYQAPSENLPIFRSIGAGGAVSQ